MRRSPEDYSFVAANHLTMGTTNLAMDNSRSSSVKKAWKNIIPSLILGAILSCISGFFHYSPFKEIAEKKIAKI